MTIAGQTIGTPPSDAIRAASTAAWRSGRVTTTPMPSSGPRSRCGTASEWTSLVMRKSSFDRKPVCAARKELVSQGTAERAGAFDVDDGTLAFTADHVASVARGDEAAQPQPVLFPFGVRSERRVAATPECAGKRPLGSGCKRGRPIGDPFERRHQVGAIGTAFDRERTLARRRQAVVGVEQRTDPCADAEALKPRRRKNDRVALPFVELAQPCVDVAAQRRDRELRKAF